MSAARDQLAAIRALPLSGPVRIMNVCGGHERTISMAGLRTALPNDIRLINHQFAYSTNILKVLFRVPILRPSLRVLAGWSGWSEACLYTFQGFPPKG